MRITRSLLLIGSLVVGLSAGSVALAQGKGSSKDNNFAEHDATEHDPHSNTTGLGHENHKGWGWGHHKTACTDSETTDTHRNTTGNGHENHQGLGLGHHKGSGADCDGGGSDPLPEAEEWLPVLEAGCTNVFADGVLSFVEAGLVASGPGWINALDAANPMNGSILLLDGSSSEPFGDVYVEPDGQGNLYLTLTTANFSDNIIEALNVNLDALLENPLPASYSHAGQSFTLDNNQTQATAQLPLPASGNLELVIHMVACEPSDENSQ